MSRSIYCTKDAFEIYIHFLAVKKHFTTNYDFFKYNGKINATVTSFERRKDKFYFYKLSKIPDAKGVILSNILKDPKIWIGELLEEESMETFNKWNKKMQSLSYVFRNELGELDEDDINNDIKVKNGDHPRLLRLYMSSDISIETLVILGDIFRFFPYWDKKISDNILYNDINNTCRKYYPFLHYDRGKMKRVVIDKYKT